MVEFEQGVLNFESEDQDVYFSIRGLAETFFNDMVNKKVNFPLESFYIKQYAKDKQNLLCLGCAAGRHIYFLDKWFDVTGVDDDEVMVKICRYRHPELNFYLFRLDEICLKERFDVIVIVNDFIASTKNLANTISKCCSILSAKGILMIKPWFSSEDYDGNKISIDCDTPLAKGIGSKFEEVKVRSGNQVEITRTKIVEYFGKIEKREEKFLKYLFSIEDFKEAFRKNALNYSEYENFIIGVPKSRSIF